MTDFWHHIKSGDYFKNAPKKTYGILLYIPEAKTTNMSKNSLKPTNPFLSASTIRNMFLTNTDVGFSPNASANSVRVNCMFLTLLIWSAVKFSRSICPGLFWKACHNRNNHVIQVREIIIIFVDSDSILSCSCTWLYMNTIRYQYRLYYKGCDRQLRIHKNGRSYCRSL